MGIGSFLKSLVSAEAAGDAMISSLEKMYRMHERAHPNEDPHTYLAAIYLTRKAGIGKVGGDESSVVRARAATQLFACVPPPMNIRALALHLLFQERPDILERCPKFVLEYGNLMDPVNEAGEAGTIGALYQKYNPGASVPSEEPKTYRDFPELMNELEARDTVFRMEFNPQQRREKLPWGIREGKGRIGEIDEAVWQKLFKGEISERLALAEMTYLMEKYYGRPYPLGDIRADLLRK